jgi:hypothetical protein
MSPTSPTSASLLGPFNALLAALLIPISLETFDATPPALLLAVLEALLEVRLLTARASSQDRRGPLDCVKILLGSLAQVLQDDFLELDGADIGISELADGDEKEVVKVVRLLLRIATRMGLCLTQSSMSTPERHSSTPSTLGQTLNSVLSPSGLTPRRSTLTRLRAARSRPQVDITAVDDVFSAPPVASGSSGSRPSRKYNASPTPQPQAASSSSRELRSLQLVEDASGSDDVEDRRQSFSSSSSSSIASYAQSGPRGHSPDYDSDTLCLCSQARQSDLHSSRSRSSSGSSACSSRYCSTTTKSHSRPPSPSSSRTRLSSSPRRKSEPYHNLPQPEPVRVNAPPPMRTVNSGFIDIVSESDDDATVDSDSLDHEETDSYTRELLRRKRALLRRLEEVKGTPGKTRRKSSSGEGIRVAVRRI